MKILHVTQGYSPALGGTEWLMRRVSEELVRQFDDDVTVFTTNCYGGEAFFNPHLPRMPIGPEEINGVKICRFPVNSRVSQCLRLPQAVAYRLRLPFNEQLRTIAGGPIIRDLSQTISQFPFDIVAASSFPLLHMFTALRSANLSGRPCVFYGGLHPDDKWGYQRQMIYQAIQDAQAYVAYTHFEAQYVMRRGASPDRVAVIGLGVDPEPFAQVAPTEAKRRLGVEDKPLVGYIGQLGGHKGVDTLAQAMPLVWQVIPDAHLLIAGARTMFIADVERMMGAWPEADRRKVIWHYNFAHEEKPSLFAAVDVFAYPSGYESFGIAFLEAWSARKPVIGCRRGAVPWVIRAGHDGLLVKYQDENGLAEAIITLLRNPRWAAALGEAGYQKVLASHTWSEVARRCREVYVETLARYRYKMIRL
jgi:glycogen synthase